MNTKRIKGIVSVFLATAIWGGVGVWIRFFPHIDSISLVFARTFIGALFFIIFSLIQAPIFFNAIKKGNKKTVLLNAILTVGTITFYTLAVKNGSVASAALLLYTIPLFVITLNNFFKNRNPINPWSILALSFSAIGVFAIFLGDLGSQVSIGSIWGLLAGLSWGLQLLESRNLSKAYPTYMGLALLDFVAIFFLTPFANFHAILFDSNILSLFFYAFASSVIAPLLFYYGIVYINSTDAGVVSLFDPIVASLAALIVIGEIPSLGIVIGGIFIIVGNILQIFSPEAKIPEILNIKNIIRELYMAQYNKPGNIAIDQLKIEQTVGFKMLFLLYKKIVDKYGEEEANNMLRQMAIERRKTWFEKTLKDYPKPDNMSPEDYALDLIMKYWQEVTPYDMSKELKIKKNGKTVTIAHSSWSPIREAAEGMNLDINKIDDIIGTNSDIWMINELIPGTKMHDDMKDNINGNFVIEFP